MEKTIEILKVPKTKSKEYKPFETEDKVLQEMISTFIQTLEKVVSKENLQILYNNISTLKIDNERILSERKIDIFRDNTITGQYYLEENIISVLPLQEKCKPHSSNYLNITEYIINLYHELLHMSSTIVDTERNVIFSGLAELIEDNSIGLAIDDAYTEMLLYRYFNLDKKYMYYDYGYEIIITRIIEEIIGKESMTNLYFNANLYGLVSSLEQYNTKENIYKFLDNFDCIYALRDYPKRYKKQIIYYHNELQKFIIETYINKLKIDITNGKITQSNYNIKLDRCINMIHIAFKKLKLENKVKIRRK